MSDFRALITAELNLAKVDKQIKDLNKKKVTLNHFTLNTEGLTQKIQAVLDGHKFAINLTEIKSASSVGDKAGQAIVDRINKQIESNSISTAIKKATLKFNTYSNGKNELSDELIQVQKDLKELNSLQDKLKVGSNSQELIANYKKFETVLLRIKNNLSLVSSDQKLASSIDMSKLDNKMQLWLEKNSKASKNFGTQISDLRNELDVLVRTGNATEGELQDIEHRFDEIRIAAQKAGETGASFTSRFIKGFRSISTYISSATLIYKAVSAVKEMYQNVLKIDTAMTGLRRVTNLSSSEYTQLFDKMTASAQKYGSTLEDIINSTSSWVKLGFDPDTAEQLSEVSAMYQHVTDLDYNTAVKNLVTAYKGYESDFKELFGDDTVQSMTRIADIYDKLGNEMPVTAAQVGEGMTKAASIMQMSGATLEQAAGMITGGGSVTQDFDAFGNALKVSALRIRGMKGQLEELGEEVDENVISVSKMQTQILNLTHGKVNIFEADGETFRNIYDVYADIAEIYDELSDTERSSLLELIAGKMRSNQIQAMINNWSDVEKATKKAYNAEGTAAQENEKYMDSMQGKINATKAAWEALSSTFLSADLLKGFIDTGTGALNILNNIVSSLGSINTLVISIAAVNVFKNIS